MFKITLSPQFSDADLTLVKQGKILKVNGDELDFSATQEGDEYPAEAVDNPSVIGGISMIDGQINITVLMPYNNPDAPESVTYPAPIIVIADGEIALPEGRCIDAN